MSLLLVCAFGTRLSGQLISISLEVDGLSVTNNDTLLGCPGDTFQVEDLTNGTGSYLSFWYLNTNDSIPLNSNRTLGVPLNHPGTQQISLKVFDTIPLLPPLTSYTIFITTCDSLEAPVIGSVFSQECPSQTPTDIPVLVAASGGFNNYAYQWQDSIPGQYWNNVGGESANPSSFVFNTGFAPGTQHFYRLQAISSFTGDTLYSNLSQVQTYNALSAGPVIDAGNLSSGDSLAVCFGSSLDSLVVFANGGDGQYSYQWESSPNGNSNSYSLINGAPDKNSLSLGLSNIKKSRDFFRVVISDLCGQSITTGGFQISTYDSLDAGKIKVKNTPAKKDTNLCFGESIDLTPQIQPKGGKAGKAPGKKYNFHWRKKFSNGSFDTIPGQRARKDTLSVTNDNSLTTGKHIFKLEVQDSCAVAETDEIEITAYAALQEASVNNISTLLCPNYLPSTSLDVGQIATGGDSNFVYQWQKSGDQNTWTDVGSSSPTADDFNFNLSNSNPAEFTPDTTIYYQLKAVCERCNDSVISAPVALQTFPALNASKISGVKDVVEQDSLFICFGGTLDSLSVQASQGDGLYHYQWEYYNSDSLKFDTIPGAPDLHSLKNGIANLTQSENLYRVKVTDECDQVAWSDTFRVVVYDSLQAGTINVKGSGGVKDTALCFNESIHLSFLNNPQGGKSAYDSASSYGYVWQYKPISNVIYDPALGSNTLDSLLVINNGLIQSGNYDYRLQLSDQCRTLETDTIQITFYEALQQAQISINDTIFCPHEFPSGTISVTVAAEGGDSNYIYQWERSYNGINWSTTSDSSLSPVDFTFNSTNSALADFGNDTTWYYRLRTYCPRCESSVVSDSITLHIYPDVETSNISGYPSGNNPDTLYICHRTSLDSLTVTASKGDGTYHYTWQYSTDGTVFDTISAAPDSYKLETGIDNLFRDTNFYRVYVHDDCDQTIASNMFTVITYDSLQAGTIQVTNSPGIKDTTLCFGDSLSLGFEHPPLGGRNGFESTSYTYRWLERDAIGAFDTVPGAGLSYLTVVNDGSLQLGAHYYKLQVIDDCEVVETDSVKVIHYEDLSKPEISVTDSIFCPGVLPFVSIEVDQPALGADSTYVYQWEKSADAQNWIAVDTSSSTTQDFNFTSLNSNASDFKPDTLVYYRLKASCLRCADSVSSDPVVIRIYPKVTSSPITGFNNSNSFADSITICHRTAVESLSVTPSQGNGDYHYDWQYSTTGTSFTSIPAALDSNILSTALSNLNNPVNFYRVIVTDGCGQSYTPSEFKVIVYDSLEAGTIQVKEFSRTDSIAICDNEELTLNRLIYPAGGMADTDGSLEFDYQWQVDTITTSGVPGFKNLKNDTAYSISFSHAPGTYEYRLRVVDFCDTVYTNTLRVRIKPLPSSESNQILGDPVLCDNQQNILFRLQEAYNPLYTYEWRYGSDTVQKLNDPTFATFPVAPLQSDTLVAIIRNAPPEQPVCERVVKKYINLDNINKAPAQSLIVKKPDLPLLICSQDSTPGLQNQTIYYQWGKLDRWYGNLISESPWLTLRYFLYDIIDTSRYYYFVRKATDTSKCYSYSFWPKFDPNHVISVPEETGLNRQSLYSLYPNPNNGHFYIQGDLEKIRHLECFNLYGQKMELNFNHQNGAIKLGQKLATGYYFIRVKTATHLFVTKILIMP